MKIMDMMKQAQQLQSKMAEMQAELEELEIEGQSGAGLVCVKVNGKGDIKSLKIDPSLMKPEDTEILEDLIIAAANDAKTKSQAQMQDKMQGLTGGLPLPPGMKLF